MRDDLRCACHICRVEDHLFDTLAEPPGSGQFAALAASSPVLAKFTNISELLAYLHSPRTGEYDWSDAGETLTALLAARATACDSELIHSVLVLEGGSKRILAGVLFGVGMAIRVQSPFHVLAQHQLRRLFVSLHTPLWRA